MKRRIKDEQRDISYGELSALSDEFETQLDEHGVIFDDEEDRDEAFFDFVQQYIDGDDDPQINWENAKVRPVRDSKRRQVRDSEDDYEDYKQKLAAFLPTINAKDVDSYYDDLYLRVTPESTAFIKSLPQPTYKVGGWRVSIFVDNIEKDRWYEIKIGNPYSDFRGRDSRTDFSQICKGGSISDSHRVKDGDDGSIKAAIDEVLADYFPKLTVDDYHIYGNNKDGLLAQPEIDGCDMYVFSSEYAANVYILDGYGVECVDGAMPDDEWVDYLINGGVEPEAAEDLIERHDWQGVVEVILDAAGAEWFLTSYSGEVFYVGGYAIYF